MNGVLVLKNFYDVVGEIQPIQRHIFEIVGLVIKRHDLQIDRKPFEHESFDSGYAELIAADRRFGGEVYDAVKQIPAFLRLISCARNERLFKELRGTDVAGVGAASYGIRIDNPYEEQFRSHWHQEFLFQPQSLDGIVFWTPLVPITAEIGPVNVCLESHKAGLCRYVIGGPYAQKTGAYRVGIADAERVTAAYKRATPLVDPGDLIVMDFLTIHQSGFNVSKRSRWAIQTRFFNFREPTGIRIGWRASVTAGTDIESIFPDNFVRGG